MSLRANSAVTRTCLVLRLPSYETVGRSPGKTSTRRAGRFCVVDTTLVESFGYALILFILCTLMPRRHSSPLFQVALPSRADAVLRTVSYALLSVLHEHLQMSGRRRTSDIIVRSAGALGVRRRAADKSGIRLRTSSGDENASFQRTYAGCSTSDVIYPSS